VATDSRRYGRPVLVRKSLAQAHRFPYFFSGFKIPFMFK